jgi:NAD(P)-dependent dehydrogenase (short-subunit alcohol dehydrogenase family)
MDPVAPVDLAGRIALVTGGASGIGRATARRLTAEGMRVCVVDRDADGARAVAHDLEAHAITADASRPDEVDAVFAECEQVLGAVDLALLNAGIAIAQSDIGALDDDQYRRIVGVNVDGVVFGARAAIRSMRTSGHGGVIIATASLAGIVPFAPDPVYALTKHAVVGFVRSLAPTVAGDGITVHAICPGLTNTAIMGDEARAHLRDVGFPLMAPEQIAAAVVTAATAPERTGACWVCQPGRPPVVYEFRDVPGPRTEGTEGRVPPGIRDGEPGIFRR